MMTALAKIAQYAVEGWRWFWANKWICLFVIATVTMLSMYGCEKMKTKSLTASLDAEKTKTALLAKSVDDMKAANDSVTKALLIRDAELKICADALQAQAAIQAQTEQTKKDAQAILDKIKDTKDPDEWAKMEAEFWNKVYGLSAGIDPKTKKAVLFKVKLVKPLKLGVK